MQPVGATLLSALGVDGVQHDDLDRGAGRGRRKHGFQGARRGPRTVGGVLGARRRARSGWATVGQGLAAWGPARMETMMSVDPLLTARALVLRDLASQGLLNAHTVSVVEDCVARRGWWLSQWSAGADFIGGLVAQDVQDMLFDETQRWPRCETCAEPIEHSLAIEPELRTGPALGLLRVRVRHRGLGSSRGDTPSPNRTAGALTHRRGGPAGGEPMARIRPARSPPACWIGVVRRRSWSGSCTPRGRTSTGADRGFGDWNILEEAGWLLELLIVSVILVATALRGFRVRHALAVTGALLVVELVVAAYGATVLPGDSDLRALVAVVPMALLLVGAQRLARVPAFRA